jgi:hypothetical protein
MYSLSDTEFETVATRKGPHPRALTAAYPAFAPAASRNRAAGNRRWPSSSHRPNLAAHKPGRHGDGQPGERDTDEGGSETVLYHLRKDNREGQHSERAKRGASGIERRGLLPALLT